MMRRLALASVLSLVAIAPAAAAGLAANTQLYRSYIEHVWNRRDPSAVKRYLGANFVEHNPNLPPGLAGRIKFATAVQAAFSDYHAEIQEIVTNGNMLVARVMWSGTQDGPYQGRPPTGRRLRFFTADFFRIENDRFVEHWDVVDSLPRAVALGLVPAPTPATPAAAPKPH